MRIAGALLLAVGLMLAAVVALLPVQVSVLGTSGSCGLPIVAVIHHDAPNTDPVTASLDQECRSGSIPRLLIALAVFFIASIIGAIMIALGGPPEFQEHVRAHG